MYDERLIREYLGKIEKSSIFIRSKKLRRLLSYLINQTLSGKTAGLKEYTIAREAFEMHKEFDPLENSLVRVTAANLRKKLNEYYSSEGINDRVRITFKTGSYIPSISLTAGFRINDPQIPVEDKQVQFPRSVIILELFHNTASEDGDLEFSDRKSAFINSLIYHLNNQKLIKIKVFHRSPPEYPEQDPDNYVYRFNTSFLKSTSEIAFFLRIDDSQDRRVIWSERLIFDETDNSFLPWIDSETQNLANKIVGYSGIIMEDFSRVRFDENFIYNKSISLFFNLLNNSFPSKLFHEAISCTENALSFYPHDSILASQLSSLYSFAYAFGKLPDESVLAKSSDMAAMAVSIDSDNMVARNTITRNAILRDNCKSAEKEASFILSKSKTRNMATASSAALYALATGEWDKSIPIINSVLNADLFSLNLIHCYLFLNEYRRDNSEGMQREYYSIRHSDLELYQILILSMFCNNDNVDYAKYLLQQYMDINPSFDISSSRYMKLVFHDSHIKRNIERGLNSLIK